MANKIKEFHDEVVAFMQSFSGSGSLPALGAPLSACTWAEISAVSKAGLGAKYFNIGDMKRIALNGNIGIKTAYSSQEAYVYILHINYPMNGAPDNNIIWGGFKTAEGKDIALCARENTLIPMIYSGTGYYTMVPSEDGDEKLSGDPASFGRNFGGWKGTNLRYDILGATSTPPSDYGKARTRANIGYNATAATLTNPKADTLLAALPSDFRNALRLWSRWIDAKGDGSNVDANVEETIDAVTLLTEFEVFGTRTYANAYEQNHQTQMDYYKNGNSKIKWHIDELDTTVGWWLASPKYDYLNGFEYVDESGNIHPTHGANSFAIAPAFKT